MDIHEPRSFAPREGGGVKTVPIDEDRPTMRAIARGHNQLHKCLDKTQQDVAAIRTALGLDENGRRVAGLASSWQAFRRTVFATTTSIAAAALVYKVVVLVAPGVLLIWTALSRAMLKGVF